MDEINKKKIIEGYCSVLIGQKPWKVFRSTGTFLLMEMGNRREYEIKGKIKHEGEIGLWLNGCAWIVDKGGEVIFGCLDEEVDREIKIFETAVIESVSIDSTRPGLDAVFTFSGNLNLRTFCNSVKQEGLGSWLVRDPSGQYLEVGPGNAWSYGME